jgi:alkylation response protein AidB-like acyl-CoA dehydrogenase
MDRALFASLWQIADDALRPSAAEADACGVIEGSLADNLRLLGDRGFLGMGVPRQYGGLGADITTQHEYTEILASACGVTAFTQQQLRTSLKHLAASENERLKRRLLPEFAAGQRFCGVALSQIRRGGNAPPLLCAETVSGGFRVSGTIPWITAWALLDGFVLGASLDEGTRHLFAYVDRAENSDRLTASEPMPLIVMRSSGTVSVEVRDLFVPEENALAVRPREDFLRADEHEITTHAALPLGCARGCERYLREMARERCREDFETAATALMFEINHCRREALAWGCDCIEHPEYKKHALRARATAIILALRAAHAVVAASGGRSQLVTETPQRLLREAQFYTNAVQTADVQTAVLDQLFSPYFGM